MNEMVCKVAKSIWSVMTFGCNSAAFDVQPKQIKDHYYSVAHAAIEAMKEPTEKMEMVGWNEAETWDWWIGTGRDNCKIYSAMIQAALDDV